MMEQFCKDVIRFLQLSYSDAYHFEIAVSPTTSLIDDITLRIETDDNHVRVINDGATQYIYALYRLGGYSVERNQYTWQKELIDIIEGS